MHEQAPLVMSGVIHCRRCVASNHMFVFFSDCMRYFTRRLWTYVREYCKGQQKAVMWSYAVQRSAATTVMRWHPRSHDGAAAALLSLLVSAIYCLTAVCLSNIYCLASRVQAVHARERGPNWACSLIDALAMLCMQRLNGAN
jgi:hypothetical protein